MDIRRGRTGRGLPHLAGCPARTEDDRFLAGLLTDPNWASSSLSYFELAVDTWRTAPFLSASLATFLGLVGPRLDQFIIKNAHFPSSLVAFCPNIKVLGLRDLDLVQPPFPSVFHPSVKIIRLSQPPLHSLFQAGELDVLKKCFPAVIAVQVDLWQAVWAQVDPGFNDEVEPDWKLFTAHIDAAEMLCQAAGLPLLGSHGRMWEQSDQWGEVAGTCEQMIAFC